MHAVKLEMKSDQHRYSARFVEMHCGQLSHNDDSKRLLAVMTAGSLGRYKWQRVIKFLHSLVYNYITSGQTWGQLHFVNSNSTQFHLVNSNSTSNFPIQFQLHIFFSKCLLAIMAVGSLGHYKCQRVIKFLHSLVYNYITSGQTWGLFHLQIFQFQFHFFPTIS